jgi:hypothetical protein
MNNNNQGAGGQDYLDKAFNAGAKKFGGAQGQKIAGNRGMSEKIVRCHPVATLRMCAHADHDGLDRRNAQGLREGHWQEGQP